MLKKPTPHTRERSVRQNKHRRPEIDHALRHRAQNADVRVSTPDIAHG